jgi:Transposase DDE domain
VNFHGERRSNATHRSTTDPEARLYKKTKGSEARLCYLGHGLMVKARLTLAEVTAEPEAAQQMSGSKRLTLAADKHYDIRDFVGKLRGLNITPHVAQNTTNRSSAIDRRTTRHAGYALSPQKRKRVEQSFGWMKMIGVLRKVTLRGREKVGWLFTFTAAAYNRIRLQRLQAKAARQ